MGYSKINVLINNAGFAFKSDSTATNAEQAKTTFEVNFYATKKFTDEIQEIVLDRILTVSSETSVTSFLKCSKEVREMLRSNDKTEDYILNMAQDFINLCSKNE